MVRLVLVLAATTCAAVAVVAREHTAAGDPSPAAYVDIVVQNPSYQTLAVDHDGVAYGKKLLDTDETRAYRLYRSTDEGRTWTTLADFPTSSEVMSIAVLSDGTLLASVNNNATYLYRSSDHGATWSPTLQFAVVGLGLVYQTLSPHSIADDGTYVYVGSYNTLDSAAHTNWIWRSADDGRTWTVVRETTTHRHIHYVQTDPSNGDLYVGYGDEDAQAAIERSRDHGQTWTVVCAGSPCLSVDIAFGQGFAIFGNDTPFSQGYVRRLDLSSGTLTALAPHPGTSFSALALNGSFLVGTTHEPNGLYPNGDSNVHLFASTDGGSSFGDVLQLPWFDPALYQKLMVQFAYPNGDFPIQISGYYGTIVGRLAPGAPTAAPVSATTPSILGPLQLGGVLGATVGTWNGGPSAFAYQWERCSTTGTSCSNVAGAIGPVYTVGADDVGRTARVVVTASNAIGSAGVASAATAVIGASAPVAPTNTVAPQVLGPTSAGSLLAATQGSWGGAPSSFAYQWQRCTAAGAACADIAGAAGVTYTLAAADVGATIRVVVSVTGAGGAATASSAPAGPIVAAAPAVTTTTTPAVVTTATATPAAGVGDGGGGGGGGGGGSVGGGIPPNLAVRVLAAPIAILAGDTGTYVLAVDDLNGELAERVVLTVALPAGLAAESASADRGPGCSLAAPVVCNLDFLGSGAASRAQVTIAVRASTPGPATAAQGSASVSSRPSDLDPADNTIALATKVSAPAAAALATSSTAAVHVRGVARGREALVARSAPHGAVVAGQLDVSGDTTLAVSAVSARGVLYRLQTGSRVGTSLSGRPHARIVYRTGSAGRITFSLRIPIPAAPRGRGEVGFVRVAASNGDGASTTLRLPFRR